MDAMQKRKIRKVAIVHFGLTVLSVVVVIMIPTAIISNHVDFAGDARAHERGEWNRAWFYFFQDVGLCLQPQFWLFEKLKKVGTNIPMLLALFTIPFWSLCFGWIFVKLDNWLNHFPVLGKRVF